jgi:hypothetical protein
LFDCSRLHQQQLKTHVEWEERQQQHQNHQAVPPRPAQCDNTRDQRGGAKPKALQALRLTPQQQAHNRATVCGWHQRARGHGRKNLQRYVTYTLPSYTSYHHTPHHTPYLPYTPPG